MFGYGVWARLLAHHSAATVAPFALLVPVVGMIAGALLFGEALSAARACRRRSGDGRPRPQRIRRLGAQAPLARVPLTIGRGHALGLSFSPAFLLMAGARAQDRPPNRTGRGFPCRGRIMHDIRAIRENPEAFDDGLRRRGLDPRAESLIALDERRRAAIAALQTRAGAPQRRLEADRRRRWRARTASRPRISAPRSPRRRRRCRNSRRRSGRRRRRSKPSWPRSPTCRSTTRRTARTRTTMSRCADGARRRSSRG